MISTVTVNYKTAIYLEKMLESLFRYHDSKQLEVFVVENGSGDDLSSLEEKFPQVKFIYSKRNLGFAGGCNLAIKETTGDFVCLVNPDILFENDALFQLEDQMQKNSRVGIGGVSLKNLDGSQQACVWHFPRPLDQFLLLLKIPHFWKNIGPVRSWLMKDFDYSKAVDVDQVMGALFCFRHELLNQIGFFDDGFFIWYEEVDYCKRAKGTGWRVRYFAEVSVKHKKGSSFEAVKTFKKQAMIRRSLRHYMYKHHGLAAWLLFTLPEPIYIFIAAVASVIKPK